MDDDCNTTIKETFQEPRKKFWLRSRKRTKSDVISVSSMDMSIDSDISKKKKRRRITEVASSIFSSGTISSKLGNTLHSSFSIQPHSSDVSFIEDDIDSGTLRKKHKKQVEDAGTLTLKSWVLDVAKLNNIEHARSTLSRSEVKRQEAIYELFCGEKVLLDDLIVLRDFYYEPLLSADIFSSDELLTLFGDIDHLIKIHSKLRDELITLRDQSGFTDTVGTTILNWVPSLVEPYIERCKTQIWARHLLEKKKATNRRFQAFLKKRLESSHSIDLWTYIDVPRSRVVKYPLLVKEILKHTSSTHVDQASLQEAMDLLAKLLKDIDKAMGDAECKLAQSRINMKLEYDPTDCIQNATELITQGQLKDARGMKFHCFLFNTCFAITRATRRITKKYNLCFPIIPKEQLSIYSEEKVQDGVAFKIGDHLLSTEDRHGKRHWLDCLKKVHRVKKTADNNKTDNPEKHINNNEKENYNNSTLATPTRSKRKSTSSITDIQFSFSLRKNLLKQKRNSIGYI